MLFQIFLVYFFQVLNVLVLLSQLLLVCFVEIFDFGFEGYLAADHLQVFFITSDQPLELFDFAFAALHLLVYKLNLLQYVVLKF